MILPCISHEVDGLIYFQVSVILVTSQIEAGLAAVVNNYPMLIGYHHFNCHYEETHCSAILPADDYYAHGWVFWRR